MKRTIVALLVVALIGAMLLVPTTANPFSSGDEVDTIEDADHLRMAPSDGPNGVYAFLNEEGEIELDLGLDNQKDAADGVNPDSVTHIDSIFLINNSDAEEEIYAPVWIEIDEPFDDNIRFYVGDDPTDSIMDRENNQTIPPGEEIEIGMRVDTTGDHTVEAIKEFVVVTESGIEPEEGDDTSDDYPDESDDIGDDTGAGDDAGTGDDADDDTGAGDDAGDDTGAGDDAGTGDDADDDTGAGDDAGDDTGAGDDAGDDTGAGDDSGDDAGDDTGTGDDAGDETGAGDTGAGDGEDGDAPVLEVDHANMEAGEDWARLAANVTQLDGIEEADVWFEWRAENTEESSDTDREMIDSLREFNATIDGLEAGESYEFRALGEANETRDETEWVAFTIEDGEIVFDDADIGSAEGEQEADTGTSELDGGVGLLGGTASSLFLLLLAILLGIATFAYIRYRAQ